VYIDNTDKSAQFSFSPASIDPHSTAIATDNATVYSSGTHTVLVVSPSNSASLTVYCSGTTSGVTFLTGWSYRKPVTIDNTGNSNTLTDYQVLVTLDTASLISEGKMQSDCDDIRFTDTDGVTTLNYWLESGCNSASTKLWVKVPSIPASSTKTIYMYYGNVDASSQSSVANTFIREIDGAQPVKGSWHFDEGSGTTANDDSGNDNDGTIYGASWVDGKYGKALSFDGVNDYVDCGNDTSLNFGTGAFSVELWIKVLTNDNTWHNLISKKYGYNSFYIGWQVWLDFRTSGAMQLRVNDGSANADNTPTASGDLKTIIQDGNYHHLVYVNNGNGTVTFYLDGADKGTVSFSMTGSLNNTEPLRIGVSTGGNAGLHSIKDEVRIYNRALSEEEISDLYNTNGYTTTNYPGKVLVRKYSSPEPTISVGAEESA